MDFSRTLISAAAVVTTLAFATSAQAVDCALTDISPNAQACGGFSSGQLLSGNPTAVAAQISALGILGFTWDGTNFNSFEKISGLAGNQTVNFASLLNGVTYIGLHFGGGTGSPTPGADSTAFYRFDAGTNLDTFTLAYNASSDAILYSTAPAIPEPETYALMLAGLGVIGFVARRRRPNA
jgi:hypothetical protein